MKERFGKLWQDWVIIGGFTFNIVARVLTNFIVFSLSAYTQAATTLEANPVAKSELSSFLLQFVVTAIGIGLGLAFYIYFRTIRKKYGDAGLLAFNTYTLCFFTIAILDMANDLGIALGFFK